MGAMKKFLLGILFALAAVVAWDVGHIAHYSLWLSQNPLHSPYKDELDSIFNQSFIYLDKGSTCEVYISEDKNYVIKIFRDKTFSSQTRKHFPGIRSLGAKRKALKMKKAHCIACTHSYLHLHEETGMIYFHLSPTNHFNKTITLTEANGSKRSLDLDEEAYFVQKKAFVSGPYIRECIKNGEIEKAEAAIGNLLEFTQIRCNQGIVMVDLQFTSNFGFIDDKPIRIDIEHLCYKESWKTGHKYHLEAQLNDFRGWIAGCCPPALLSFFDEEVNRLQLIPEED